MKKGLILILSLWVSWACQDLNSIQPPAELDLDGLYGVYVDTVFYATESEFTVDHLYNSGNALKLNVGAFNGFESGFLLKFVGLPTDTVYIDSAYIQLSSLGKFGSSSDEMTILLYKVEDEWDEQEANTIEKWHTYQPTTLLGRYTFPPQDSLDMRFDLDTALVNEWRRDTDSNKGLYFAMEKGSANYIREIESLENPLGDNWPKICYYTQQNTVTLKDSVRTGLDVTIFNYDGQVFEKAKQDNDLLIGSGIAVKAFVRFDELYSLPETAIIQEADMILTVDDRDILTDEEGNLLDNPNHSGSYYLRNVSDADSALTSFTVDSSFANSINFNFNLAESGGIISLNGKSERSKFGLNMIQNMINGQNSSRGFLIHFIDEGQDVSLKRIYNSGEKNVKLHIRYFRVDNNGL